MKFWSVNGKSSKSFTYSAKVIRRAPEDILYTMQYQSFFGKDSEDTWNKNTCKIGWQADKIILNYVNGSCNFITFKTSLSLCNE